MPPPTPHTETTPSCAFLISVSGNFISLFAQATILEAILNASLLSLLSNIHWQTPLSLNTKCIEDSFLTT